MHTFILAGGFATRLWPLTETRAKPLLPLAGEPLITHLVRKTPAHFPVTVSTNAAFADSFQEWKEKLGRTNLLVAVERTLHDDQKLGALGALAAWITEERIAEDILVLTGDNYLGFSLEHFLAAYREGTPLLAAFDIGDKEKATAFGTVILDDAAATEKGTRRIRGFEEKPKESKTTLVSTGCAVLPAATLPILCAYAKEHPDNVGGIFEELIRQGIGVDAFIFREPWLDIGSFPSYLEAHRLIVGKDALIHPDAHVDDCDLEGSVSVAKGSTIKKSTLTDCIIFEGCTITDCTLKDCVVDDNCVLTGIDLTGKMLRAGTVLTME